MQLQNVEKLIRNGESETVEFKKSTGQRTAEIHAVPDGNRIYRCSKCGKRLHPRKIFEIDGELAGWRLPPHKKKGHKIRAIKDRQRKRRLEGEGHR